jgi:hypothetical protein
VPDRVNDFQRDVDGIENGQELWESRCDAVKHSWEHKEFVSESPSVKKLKKKPEKTRKKQKKKNMKEKNERTGVDDVGTDAGGLYASSNLPQLHTKRLIESDLSPFRGSIVAAREKKKRQRKKKVSRKKKKKRRTSSLLHRKGRQRTQL